MKKTKGFSQSSLEDWVYSIKDSEVEDGISTNTVELRVIVCIEYLRK